MYKSGHKDGCQDGIALLAWKLHEKYGWNDAVKQLVYDSLEFIDSYMKEDQLVDIKDVYEALRDECGIEFERNV